MNGRHQRFARLSDADIAEVARSMRSQASASAASSVLVANALDAIVQRRRDLQEARRRSHPVHAGLRVLRRFGGWASARAATHVAAMLGLPTTL